jgi:hypothetical protein
VQSYPGTRSPALLQPRLLVGRAAGAEPGAQLDRGACGLSLALVVLRHIILSRFSAARRRSAVRWVHAACKPELRRRTCVRYVCVMRAWMIVSFLGLSIVQQPTARPGAPRLGWPGGCPTAPPMAYPRHVAPPHPAVLAHVSRGASRFSCARPARGGAHVGKAVPCSLGGPREAVSGCLREAAGAELRREGATPNFMRDPGFRNASLGPCATVQWKSFWEMMGVPMLLDLGLEGRATDSSRHRDRWPASRRPPPACGPQAPRLRPSGLRLLAPAPQLGGSVIAAPRAPADAVTAGARGPSRAKPATAGKCDCANDAPQPLPRAAYGHQY